MLSVLGSAYLGCFYRIQLYVLFAYKLDHAIESSGRKPGHTFAGPAVVFSLHGTVRVTCIAMAVFDIASLSS
jgi:hypothetical protein